VADVASAAGYDHKCLSFLIVSTDLQSVCQRITVAFAGWLSLDHMTLLSVYRQFLTNVLSVSLTQSFTGPSSLCIRP